MLSKAVACAAERLDISRALLAKVLGVSPATVTRLYSGEYQLTQGRKEWDFALLFVRAFRSLDSIVGGDETTARKWLNSENNGLNGRPIELICNTEGLVRVVHYLDASCESSLVLAPASNVRYSLSELMAQCDPKAPMPEEMNVWNGISPVGKEFGSDSE